MFMDVEFSDFAMLALLSVGFFFKDSYLKNSFSVYLMAGFAFKSTVLGSTSSGVNIAIPSSFKSSRHASFFLDNL